MGILLAIMTGGWVGFSLGLIPGLSVALGLGLFVVLGMHHLIGNLETACFIASAAASAIYSRNLALVANPLVTVENVEALDPVLRMVLGGKGPQALKLQTFAVDISWIPIAFLGGVLVLATSCGLDLAKFLDDTLTVLGIPLILCWVWTCIKASHRPRRTALGLTLTSVFGYLVLHAPAISGSEYQLGPILAALFGVPIAFMAYSAPMIEPEDMDLEVEHEDTLIRQELGVLGAFIGCATGFFAGLGSTSLVAMVGSLSDSDEDYVLMSTAGSASNDIMALLLVVAAGMGRSGEAVLLGRMVSEPHLSVTLIVGLAVAFGAYLGRSQTLRMAKRYAQLIGKIPRKGVIGVGLALTLMPVFLAGGASVVGQLTTWLLLVCGLLVAAWCRVNYLPNQVAFGSMAIPLVIQSCGLVPYVNRILYW